MSETKWYVYGQGDPWTNEVLSTEFRLGETKGFGERCRDVLCGDGRERNLWIAGSFKEVSDVLRAKKDPRFKVSIFVQEGNGKVRLWTDPSVARRKKKLARKVRRGDKVATIL